MTAEILPDPQSTSSATSPTALVIGSGFGGLAAAIRLSARGYQVTIVEKLDQPGGRARVHRQGGFAFDAGPTIITAPFLLEELWSLCGRKMSDEIELKPMSPFYRITFDDGEQFDYSGDLEANHAEIARFSPEDIAGYDQYMKASKAIYKKGFEDLSDVPFNHFTDMLRIVPDMMKLQSFRSVYGLVSRYIKNEYLRVVLSFHPLLIGGNPFATTSIYALISFLEQRHGVYSAIGGTGAIISGLVNLAVSRGVNFKFNAEVAEITIDNGHATGIRLQNGEHLGADVVVSNADAAWTYQKLIPQKHRGFKGQNLSRAKYSNGLFVWYFGTRKQYTEIPHHSILLGPRYQGLLKDIFDHKTLSDDFSLYLHRPSASDKSVAPSGCDAFYALVPVPNLDGDVDWETEKEAFRQKVEKRLEERLLPGLKDALVESRVTTPLDFKTDLCSYRGAGFSLQPLLTQSAWFRPHNRSESVEGLYFVGAGTHPGAGVPGVLSSAKILDTVVPHASQLIRH